jgi:hypothetical protein
LPSVVDDVTQLSWYLPAYKIGVRIKASASDTMLFRNCVIATGQDAYFTLDSTCSSSATYRFDGMVLIGFTPIWLDHGSA